MISSEQALKSPRARLTDAELKAFQFAEAVIDATLGEQYDGLPRDFPMAVTEVPVRVVYALKRRYEKPAPDGSRWKVTVHELRDGTKLVGHRMAFEPAPPADFVMKSEPAPTGAKPVSALGQVFEELAALRGIRVDESRVKLSIKPKLSVLFGTYNRIECLRGIVESVRASVGGVPYEMVICDGGSTDGSREYLAAQRDVVLVGERHLEGAVKAFNQAYAMSRGEYVANLNDDCLVEGDALGRAVEYLDAHPDVGQVAFGFNTVEGDVKVNKVWPRASWPTEYANFGVARRTATEEVVAIQGGFWNPLYRTYAADVEFSAWLHKLGWKVAPLPHLRISDTRIEDVLRKTNAGGSGVEAKRMGVRWPAEAFKPDGPDPRVTAEELARFRAVVERKHGVATTIEAAPATRPPDDEAAIAEIVGWDEPQEEERLRKVARAVRALDPVGGQIPRRAAMLKPESVLHVSLCTDADPQAGLVRALKTLGQGGYREVRWYADYGSDPVARQAAILDAAREIYPTIVFMQLQAKGAVDVETVRQLRQISPGVVIATWCGDIALENSPYDVDWQVPLGRAVDLTLHSSMSHVRALRAAGVHGACHLQIGYDDFQYRPRIPGSGHGAQGEPATGSSVPHETPLPGFDYDVCFLGSRYDAASAFARTMRRHDAEVRDEAVLALKRALGDRFGLFGRGWSDFLREHGVEHRDEVVPLERAHEVYWRSRMALSVSLDNSLECYSSDRLHRILGCGTAAIVKNFPGMSVWGLESGNNCLTWNTPEEAVALVHGGIIDPGDAKSIAAAGAKLAREHLTWDVRVRELQAIVDAVRNAR